MAARSKPNLFKQTLKVDRENAPENLAISPRFALL
jgi:hypothetical protein